MTTISHFNCKTWNSSMPKWTSELNLSYWGEILGHLAEIDTLTSCVKVSPWPVRIVCFSVTSDIKELE